MKKILIILLLPLMSNAQVLDVIEKGYYQTFVGDSLVSSHTKISKANAKILELRLLFPDTYVHVEQPNVEPDIDIDELVYLVNYNYNFADKGITVYYGDKGDITDTVLSDFDLFDVVLQDKYMNEIAQCKQGEIVDLPNIEEYDHFFLRYTSEAFAEEVYKMRVRDNKLISY